MEFDDILSSEAIDRIQVADASQKVQSDHLDDISSIYNAGMVESIMQHPYRIGQTVVELLTKVYELTEQVEQSQRIQRQYDVMTDVMIQHVNHESHNDCCMPLIGDALVDHGMMKVSCDSKDHAPQR